MTVPQGPANWWGLFRLRLLLQINFICAGQNFAYSPKDVNTVATKRTGTGTGRPRGGKCRMIRSELIQKIADENPHLTQRHVEKIVNTVFEEIIEALAKGDRVELRGFGAFSVKARDARVGRNPRTGEAVKVDDKKVPFFKTGKLLRDRLNGK